MTVILPSRRVVLTSGSRTVTLPKDLMLESATLWEGFEDSDDWTPNSATVADNTTQFNTGTQSVTLTNTADSGIRMVKTVNWDLSGNWQHMTVWWYLHNADLTDYGNNSVILMLCNDAGQTQYMRCWQAASQMKVSGWQAFHCAKADFGAVGGGTFASAIIRCRLGYGAVATGKTCAVSFDSLTTTRSIPAVLLRFDDGYASHYTTGFDYMRKLGIRGTLAAQTDAIGTAGRATWAQLRQMDAAGWTIANHTNSASELAGQAEADQETQITGGHDALLTNGLPRGSHYLIFPSGTSDANTVTAMTNLGVLLGGNAMPTTNPLGFHMVALPFAPTWQFGSNGTAGMSAATFTGLVDLAVAGGYIMPFHWHDIGGAGEQTAATFQTCMDYVYSKWLAGQLAVITYDDLYNLTQGPVTVPVP